MNGYQVFLLLLAGYITILIGTGYYFNKRLVSLKDFLLAGKKAGPLRIGFSAAASWLTAGAILAVIGFFILLGMGSIWGFVAPNILALLIIALFVKKIRSVPAMTQPELLEIRYGKSLRTPVALIIIVVMILFAVADIKGFAMVLQVFYGISQLHAALIVGLSVAVYVSLGGLSAVIATDTIQFLCLSTFVMIMAFLVLGHAGDVGNMQMVEVLSTVDGRWWNPMSIGLPMVLIFTFAIIPGWITEQDPWQKVWAAGSTESAKRGMLLGSLLVAVVFAGCAVIAVGLNNLYPEIQEMGFPMGMGKAEPALLNFILSQNYSEIVVALCAVALATAAMSCADTFAASGGSCIARDIYQRTVNPAATMKEMLTVNRLSVLFIIACATAGSFFIDSIIDAIHIATFVASASYFFVLLGGMYWKRGTSEGASASMIVGFVCQSGMVIYDVVNTAPGAPPALEAFHPLFMGHGVILAMAASGIVYVTVSLVTAPTPRYRLAPFFSDKAEELAATSQVGEEPVRLPAGKEISEVVKGDMVNLHVSVDLPVTMAWQDFIRLMSTTYGHWISFSGNDSLRRCTKADLLSCVTILRGEHQDNIWLELEGDRIAVAELKGEMIAAYNEVKNTFSVGHA